MSAIVLNVDDNLDDALLLRRAWRKANATFELHFAEDGQFAIDYLAGRDDFADRTKHPLPTLILLDLNMPRKNGLEFLEWLRASRDFRDTPVAVFTSSTSEHDIRAAVERGADCYLAKPLDYGALVELVSKLEEALRQERSQICCELAQLPECCAPV